MPSTDHPHLDVRMVDGVAVVHFTDINLIFQSEDVEALSAALLGIVQQEGKSKLLLNLGQVQYMCSSMLVKLIGLGKTINQAQGRLKLCGLSPVLGDTFRVSKLDHLFDIHDDEASALAHFPKERPSPATGLEAVATGEA